MADFGIVCEFNPFHNGHAHLLAEARRMGADRIVCVMSGCAVQRGELAVADPYVRAEAALKNGADLVLQLPFPWSAASADYFASAGVTILSEFCDTLFFGSECGDIDLLTRAAEQAETEEGRDRFKEALLRGERAAKAFSDSLQVESVLSSNDLLGVAYIRAVQRNHLSLSVQTVRRRGAAYRDESMENTEYPSATAIRKLWREGKWNAAAFGLPPVSEALFRQAAERGELTDTDVLDRAVLTFFRLHEGRDFDGIAEAGGGIANRVCVLARESRSAVELFEKLRTKQYTDARLRRAMLYCMTGVKQTLLGQDPEYTLLLGATAAGRELLAEKKKTLAIPVLTKPADVPKDSAQWRAEETLQALFTLAREETAPSGALLRKGAVIL